MNYIICVLLSVLGVCHANPLEVAAGVKVDSDDLGLTDLQIDALWGDYKKDYSKIYVGDADIIHRLLFVKSLVFMKKHNEEADLGMHTFTVGMNAFTDMDEDEFKKYYLGYKRVKGENMFSSMWRSSGNATVPDELDWREKDVVGKVKNQEQCGSCWAFAAIASLESRHKIVKKKKVVLSEQNLVDCAGRENSCNGGMCDRAYEHIKKSGGVDTEDSYPYKAKDMNCNFKKESVGAQVDGYVKLPKGDEEAMKECVATVGPVTVAIDAGGKNFMSYKNGIFMDKSCKPEDINHAVAVVGYGTENNKDYWILRNSWGDTWGEKGYMRLARNKNNHCGIAEYVVYPILPEENGKADKSKAEEAKEEGNKSNGTEPHQC